ncbi:probable 2-oxoglutarate-dependent dioxygenase AOP1 [Tripterygium wilfordii]|uniref:probable 2-oxoglutarate-dependent dioxygenase AOP1 n=1 Tax=Tripterygium wilfordii TaxID=458696 RepID=UPI0018F856F2|nr:probable 2-oxoglutarate-dependent dioxygenase AOP1 [Tripterygium wilfordii]
MSFETPLEIPVVDFSSPDMNPGSSRWDSVKDQVWRALEEYGWFEALYDRVAVELSRKTVLGSLEELFELPLETKRRNVSKKPSHGYCGQFPGIPLFESIGVDGANITQNVESLTTTLWPQGNQRFSKKIQSYSEQVGELDEIIRRMILESLGVEKYLDEHINSTNYLLRVSKYKGPKTSATKLGLNGHTDRSYVTILCQNQIDGLEVQTKDGGWITYKPSSPHSFVVMIGESLYAWSNGRLHIPYHRVTVTGNEDRYSVALFSMPKEGYIIRIPEELVDEDHPLHFKPFDMAKYMGSTVLGQEPDLLYRPSYPY